MSDPTSSSPPPTPASPTGPCKPLALSFGTFVLSLAQSALAEIHQAKADKAPEHLDMARGSIDVLELLECKTRGNLTEEEVQLLSALLYEVRMAWLAAGKPATP